MYVYIYIYKIGFLALLRPHFLARRLFRPHESCPPVRHLYISTNQTLQLLIQIRYTVFKIIGVYV